MDEPVYDVVWPLGASQSELVAAGDRVTDFSNATVAALFHVGFRDGEVYPALKSKLQELYPGITILDRETFGDIHGRQEAEVVEQLPENLRKHGVDAVICGMGC